MNRNTLKTLKSKSTSKIEKPKSQNTNFTMCDNNQICCFGFLGATPAEPKIEPENKSSRASASSRSTPSDITDSRRPSMMSVFSDPYAQELARQPKTPVVPLKISKVVSKDSAKQFMACYYHVYNTSVLENDTPFNDESEDNAFMQKVFTEECHFHCNGSHSQSKQHAFLSMDKYLGHSGVN